jgi:hypothetical protein
LARTILIVPVGCDESARGAYLRPIRGLRLCIRAL